MPTTRAPARLANCPATEPTAPDAAETTTVSPGFGWQISANPAIGRGARHARANAEDRRRQRRHLTPQLNQTFTRREAMCLPAARADHDVAQARSVSRADAITSPTVSPVITSPIWIATA